MAHKSQINGKTLNLMFLALARFFNPTTLKWSPRSLKTSGTQGIVAVASPRIDAAFFWLGALFSISLGTAVIPRRNEKQMNYAKFWGPNKVHYRKRAKVWNVTRLHPLTRGGSLPRAPRPPFHWARGISEIWNRNFCWTESATGERDVPIL